MNQVHPQLEVIFAQAELRMTTARRAVFHALETAEAPQPIGEIAKKCPQIDRVSVYRTVELFVSLGILEPVPVGWKQHYELTGPFKSHHHHLSCTNCGLLIDVHSKKLELLVASIAKDYNFAAGEHKFEVSGLCQNCRAK